MDYTALAGTILYAFAYLALGIGLITLNFLCFEWFTRFSVRKEVFLTQNESLGHIMRGQVIAIGILTMSMIYFLGVSHSKDAQIMDLKMAIMSIIAFGFIGIIMLQGSLALFSRYFHLEREIIAEDNRALARTVEGYLIAIACIIAAALYAY
jgi:uncharacterized membrane protein YjfL (UPF0719 family)